jgi:DNA-directed RNA polymerase III subunit RPC2
MFSLYYSAYQSSFSAFKKCHGGEVVDRVVLCNDKDSNMCIKILARHTRRPEVKFCLVYYEVVFLV